MNAQLEERLQRILDAHSLPCGAVFAANGEVRARAGDFDRFASAGLVSALLGPYGSPKATFHHVQCKEQIKPIIWGQGDEFAFLDSAGGLVIVVFGRNSGGVIARAKLSRLVGKTIAAEFTGHDE